MNSKTVIMAAIGAALLNQLTPHASADVITDWNLITLNAIKTDGADTLPCRSRFQIC
jgi:hypothetical protein